MNTILTNDPVEAAMLIQRGGIVAFPTETVYGLGANVFDENAIAKVFTAKKRPADNPLIAHIASVDQIRTLASSITQSAQKLIDAFFPGPLTVVLQKTAAVSAIATAGLDTIGIRMPRSELARQFIAASSTPLVAPSANLSGRPSPTTWQAVLEDLDGRIDCILQGEPTEIGLESTVVDCTGEAPVLLRPGAISLRELQSVVPSIRMGAPDDTSEVRSPGLRHKHYSPRAKVVLIDVQDTIAPPPNTAFIGLSRPTAEFAAVKICQDTAEYAHTLFEFFRACDRSGIETIFCERVAGDGIGAALTDRLERAARG